MLHTLPLLLPLAGGVPPLAEAPPLLAVARLDITAEVRAAIEDYDAQYSAWVDKMRAASEEEREALYDERPSPEIGRAHV